MNDGNARTTELRKSIVELRHPNFMSQTLNFDLPVKKAFLQLSPIVEILGRGCEIADETLQFCYYLGL